MFNSHVLGVVLTRLRSLRGVWWLPFLVNVARFVAISTARVKMKRKSDKAITSWLDRFQALVKRVMSVELGQLP